MNNDGIGYWLKAAGALILVLAGYIPLAGQIFIAAMAADIITGLICSFKEGAWASAVMRKGLAIKAGEAFAVGILLVIEAKTGAPFGTALAGWFTVHEAGSSVENLRRAGVSFPSWVDRVLASAEEQYDNQNATPPQNNNDHE